MPADTAPEPPGWDRLVQAQRFAAQRLSGDPARSPVAVAERLLAIQGQDPRGARLAIRSRTTGLTAADVDRALTRDRSLVITWLNRGTLHLVRSEDYWWLHPLTAKPQFQLGCQRILSGLGVSAADADKGVAVVEQALVADGPLTRAQLADRLSAAGLPSAAGCALHVLILASLRGIAVRGPMIGTQHAYVSTRDWLGPPPGAFDRDAALAELARRYLAGHGPASDRDLAKWAGLPLGQVRNALHAIGAEIRELPGGLVELAAAPREDVSLPPPRLLGAYDAVLLGWASREPVLRGHQGIVTVNGLFRPFALVDGQAAGIWTYSAGEVTLDRFGPLPADVETALAVEARDVQRFLAGSPEAGPDGAELDRAEQDRDEQDRDETA
ncbi:MAG TPA: winged helix DNA-binding domain-containing protein [Streptosporangiaceae bacterium]|nr:winged helix DNA-binding domain-containing protein [Streptosporangiaceae bacterium]